MDDRLIRAEAIAIEAKAAFRNQRFEHASARFMDAYALSRSPALVYNAARAMEEAGNWAKADDLFSLYLGLEGLGEGGRRDARAHRARVRAELAKQAEHAEPAEPAEPAKHTTLAKRSADQAATGGEGTSGPVGVVGGGPGRAAPPTLDAFPVWQTVGAGTAVVASVATGVWATSLAAGLSLDDVQSDADAAAYREDRDRARRLRAASIASGVVGLGLAGWVVWELVSADPASDGRSPPVAARMPGVRPRSDRWRFVPTVSPGRASLEVQLGF